MEQTNGVNAVVKPVETATKLSQLGMGTWAYFNGHHRGSPADLMEGPPGNLAGYSAIPLSMGFDYHSSQPNFARTKQFSINPTIIDGYVYIRTASTLRAFPLEDAAKYGIPLVLEDYEIEGWKAATERPTGGISYHETPEFRAFIVSSHERPAKHEPYKYVTDMEMFGPINRIGEMLSRSETLRQDALKHFNSKEGYQLMQEHLVDSEGIEHLGVVEADGVIYAIGRYIRDGKVALFMGTRAYEYLSREAERFGLRLEDMIMAKLGEEAMHHYRKSHNRDLSTLESLIAEERATKEDLLAFYTRLRDGSESNPQLRAKYSKIVRSLINDVATIGRYIDIHTASREEIERIDTQVTVLMAEAYAKGCKTDKDVMDYVDGKLKEQSAKEDNKESRLEKAAKNVKVDSEATDEEGTLYETAQKSGGESSEEVVGAEGGEAETSE